MALPSANSGSSLLMDEYFNAEDSRFVDELRNVNDSKKLAGLAERWKKDPRPWARQQMLAYAAMPFDRNGHQPLVKRLFKHAEARKDDELMAVFLAGFDGLVRRSLRTRHAWNREERRAVPIEHLYAPRNAYRPTTARNPKTGAIVSVPGKVRNRHGFMLFSYSTRYYLRRRAWRYFRRAGFQRPNEYPALIARALALYTDESLASGPNVLDSWSLLHACFMRHDALLFGAAQIKLKENRGLSDLTAAPAFPKLWSKTECAPLLLNLVTDAKARLVRVWSIQLLRATHQDALHGASPEDLLKLLDHEDEEVQHFGAELLKTAAGLEKLPVSGWLRLLKTRNLSALQIIADCFVKFVQPERLELAQAIEMTCERAAPVARLGFTLLKAKRIESPEDREAIAAVAAARCGAIGAELGQWALGILGGRDVYVRDLISRFFDSLQPEIRGAAWQWIVSGTPNSAAAFDDAGLWARMVETPYDDVRLKLVDLLEVRSKLPGTSADVLIPVWCAVLLGVHRGGRQKGKAVRQIGAAILENPQRAVDLLPVLAVAVRSVRPSEARAGLAALVAAAGARPEIAGSIQRFVPELQLEAATLEAKK